MNTPRPVSRFTGSKFGRLLMRRLDNWKPWVVVLLAGLIAVNVWTLTIYRTQSKVTARQAASDAARATEKVANANSQHTSCVNSIPFVKKINAFIAGDRIIRNTLVRNAKAVLDGTPPGSSMYATRAGNYNRLRQAREQAFQVEIPVPTKKSCAALRTALLKSP